MYRPSLATQLNTQIQHNLAGEVEHLMLRATKACWIRNEEETCENGKKLDVYQQRVRCAIAEQVVWRCGSAAIIDNVQHSHVLVCKHLTALVTYLYTYTHRIDAEIRTALYARTTHRHTTAEYTRAAAATECATFELIWHSVVSFSSNATSCV